MFCYHCGQTISQITSFCPFCGTSLSVSANEPAHVSLRLVNFLLDAFFIGLIGFVFHLFSSLLVALLTPFTQIQIVSSALLEIINFILVLGYGLFFEAIWQKTPAKWITKTKVVSNDGSKPKFWRIVGRSLARFIPFEPFSYLFSPVGWHDSLSNTLVVPDQYTPTEVQQINLQQLPKQPITKLVVVIITLFILLWIIISAVYFFVVLSSIAPKFRDQTRIEDTNVLGDALNSYHDDFKRFPESLSELVPRYIDKVPTAPEPPDGKCSEEDNRYKYRLVNPNDFRLGLCIGEATATAPAGPIEIYSNKSLGK